MNLWCWVIAIFPHREKKRCLINIWNCWFKNKTVFEIIISKLNENFSSEFKRAFVHKSYFPSVPSVTIAFMIAAWWIVLMWITAPTALIISVSSKLPGQTEGIWEQRDTHLESHLRLPTQPLEGLGAVSLQVVLEKKKKRKKWTEWVKEGEARGRTKGGERKTNHLSCAIWSPRAGGSCSALMCPPDMKKYWIQVGVKKKNCMYWELWSDEYFLFFSKTHIYIFVLVHTLTHTLSISSLGEKGGHKVSLAINPSSLLPTSNMSRRPSPVPKHDELWDSGDVTLSPGPPPTPTPPPFTLPITPTPPASNP